MYQHKTLIFIFAVIVLIVGQGTVPNNAGKDVNTLTEKACKILIYSEFPSSIENCHQFSLFFIEFRCQYI